MQKEIDQKRADRLVTLFGELAVLDFEIVVAVPRLASSMP